MRRLLALAALVALSAPLAEAAEPVFPARKAEIVPIGKAAAPVAYFRLPAAGLVFRLEGPGTLSGFVKTHYAPGEKDARSGTLRLAGVEGLPAELPLSLRYSRRAEYADGRQGSPGRGEAISFDIPAGRHELRVTGEVEGKGGLQLVLFYDGPPQWDTEAFAPPKPREPGAWKQQLGFTWRSGASLKFTYDDNAYKMSSEYIDEYLERRYWNEERYQNVERVDDLVLAPGLSLEGRRKDLIAWGQTRLGFRYAANAYLHNTALFNHEFRVYLRQSMGPGSLELYYNYSPSKYLRQLNDRPPLVSENTGVVSEEFRLERNKLVAIWRQRLHRRVSSTWTLTRKLYYYNEPHLENDTVSTDWKASFGITVAKPLSLKLEYEYSDAVARAIDVVGEDPATSPASDGTYKGNKFNGELRWKWPFKRLSSDIRLRAQYVLSYFSAYGDEPYYAVGDQLPAGPLFVFDGNGPIALDTYHTGRQDNVYTYQIKGGRKLPARLQEWIGWEPSIRMNFGFSYAERDVDSPWWGDIKEDKNWISRTYWVGFSTRLF